MKKIINHGFPIYLLGIFILAFGLQVPKLGFVLDDWVILYARYIGGNQNLYQYSFLVNRPNITWIWEAGFALLGYSALRWQILSLAWRFLAVIFIWLGWKQVWPNHKTEISMAAALFAVYPIFAQQAAAISFTVHWVCLTLYAVSIYLMILAFKNRQLKIPLIIASLITGGLNIFSMEYFVGLELLRPVIIWILLSNEQAAQTQKVKRVIFYWSPFVLLLISYLCYRFLWMPTPGYDRNSTVLLTNFLSNPFNTSVNFSLTVFRDFLNVLFGGWADTIQPSVINFDTPASFVALGLVVLVALLSAGFLFLQAKKEAPGIVQKVRFFRTALPFGLLSVGFGLLPVWMTGQAITAAGNYADRFSLPILAGASLLLIGLLDWLSQDFFPKLMITSSLVGLAAGFQFREESINRYSWENQTNIYWQLKWRIPAVQTPTAFYGDGALAQYMGSWADDAAYNMLYPSKSPDGYEGTWYFDLNKQLGSLLDQNADIDQKKMENLHYRGNSINSLVFQMHGAPGQCVWLLSENDGDNPYLADAVRPALKLSNLNRVIGELPTTLPEEIYGPEIPHTWCYFFEKADLARQYSQWDQVVQLWNAAQSAKAKPSVPVEYVPFIQGAAHTGNWNLALEITKKANDPNDINGNYLCSIWKNLTANQEIAAAIIDNLQNELGCKTPLK